MRVAVFVTAFTLVACRAKEKCPDADAGVAIVAASANVAPLDSGPRKARVSVAYFGDDGLSACIDFTFAEHFPGSAGSSKDKDAGKQKTTDKNTREIEQACADAFNDRKELASCTVTQTDDAGVDSVIVHYYDAGALDDDHEMRDCLEKGRWHGVSRDDPAYKSSLLRSHAKASQRQIKKLQQQLGEEE